ncbi:MAG: SAM-dependent methyltransferase, partial [Elainellaceae cyanobacterium]
SRQSRRCKLPSVLGLQVSWRVISGSTLPFSPLLLFSRKWDTPMTQQQVRREMNAVGLEWINTEDILPRQHLMVFEKS